jgi:hypothetical protein
MSSPNGWLQYEGKGASIPPYDPQKQTTFNYRTGNDKLLDNACWLAVTIQALVAYPLTRGLAQHIICLQPKGKSFEWHIANVCRPSITTEQARASYSSILHKEDTKGWLDGETKRGTHQFVIYAGLLADYCYKLDPEFTLAERARLNGPPTQLLFNRRRLTDLGDAVSQCPKLKMHELLVVEAQDGSESHPLPMEYNPKQVVVYVDGVAVTYRVLACIEWTGHSGQHFKFHHRDGTLLNDAVITHEQSTLLKDKSWVEDTTSSTILLQVVGTFP